MGFIKRGLGQLQVDKPALPNVDGVQNQNILPKVANDTAAEILNDLQQLFKYAHQIFSEIMVISSATSQRIANLGLRADNCQNYVPQAEAYLSSVPASTFTTTSRIAWAADALQTAQLLTKSSRDESLKDLLNKNNPPPNFAPLDPFAEDRIPCIKKYTNPDFFIDEWLEQQKREREKLMERREKRHNARKPKPEQQRKKSVREVEVGKLKKTRYDEFGNKIEDDSIASTGSTISTISRGPAQPLSARVAVSTMDASDRTLQAPTLRPRGPHLSVSPATLSAPTTPTGSTSMAAVGSGGNTPTRVTPPAPLSTPGMATLRSFTPAQSGLISPRQPPPPQTPALPTVSPPPPPPVGSDVPRPPVAPVGAPAPPPPGPPPPGPPPPGPPPPGPPPPGPPPSTGDNTPASGIQDARSSLLGQITAGLKLKKVEAVEREPKPIEPSGAAIDVAAILQRRVALEYSDDESESDNDDWDDDGDFDD